MQSMRQLRGGRGSDRGGGGRRGKNTIELLYLLKVLPSISDVHKSSSRCCVCLGQLIFVQILEGALSLTYGGV